ncbi:MAG: acyclic terpene utilization AtuA family protein [Bacteroidota bacterium]
MKKNVRIGSGAGYSGDRISPAVELAEKGEIGYLVFECLAERTIALAQQLKIKKPQEGYDPLLVDRMSACIPVCKKRNIRIISNMGAANPVAGLEKIIETAGTLGIRGLKVAAIEGDNVLDFIRGSNLKFIETGTEIRSLGDRIISANAYLGALPVVEALHKGADIIITGRVADPSLFIAPLIYEFNWLFDNYNILGQATVMGHLLECAGQVTGGYFADPGYKDVPELARIGFPLAEVNNDGAFIITKVKGSGGAVTEATCKEQLLYEIHDPAAYITPDVIADFTGVRISEKEPDVVEVKGGRGTAKTGFYKVSVGYQDSYIGEGQISYGGPGCVEKANLSLKIVRERLKFTGINISEARFDIIGLNSLHGDKLSHGDPYEVRVRVTARTDTLKDAIRIGNEVETLYTNGPAGGGGVVKSAREVIAIGSTLISSDKAKHEIIIKST